MSMKEINFKWRKGLLFVVLAVLAMFSAARVQATTIYDDTTGYTSGVPYDGRLQTYVVGSGSTDFASEFGKYKTYFISHTGTDVVRPISLKKGALHITMFGYNGATGAATLYSDSAMTKEVGKVTLSGGSTVTASGSYQENVVIKISKSQTYYIAFSNSSGRSALYQFTSQQYDGSNRVLTATPTLSYVDVPNGATYYCVQPQADGYITLAPKFISNGYKDVNGEINVTLCDSKKKAITKTKTIGTYKDNFSKKMVYAVSEGTYWLKVTSAQQTLFTMGAKFTAVTDKSGLKMDNAQSIKSGKWYNGLSLWEDTTTKGDYYKFTLKKASVVTISLKGNCGSGKVVGTVSGDRVNGSYSGLSLKKIGGKSTWKVQTRASKKLPAGTYYIRIAKDTKKTNAAYQLKMTAK